MVFLVNDTLDVMLVCRHVVHTHVFALVDSISELDLSCNRHAYGLPEETGSWTY